MSKITLDAIISIAITKASLARDIQLAAQKRDAKNIQKSANVWDDEFFLG